MENEELIHCPYNFAHVILKHRMAAHLIKCRKQHSSSKFSTCPFNSTHDVPTIELEFHLENCPDRRKLDSFLYTCEDSTMTERSAESFNIDLPPSSENWDEEASGSGSYLDIKDKKLENEPIFQVPVGMSKAEKREFTIKQAKKFGEHSGGTT